MVDFSKKVNGGEGGGGWMMDHFYCLGTRVHHAVSAGERHHLWLAINKEGIFMSGR